MNAISATRRTLRREWTAFGTLLIISVGMMGVSGTGPARDLEAVVNRAANPAETALNSVADAAGSYFSALTQIDRLASKNKQLADENLQLQEELDRMGAISKLNDDWTKITAEAAGVPYQTETVRVIVRDISDVSSRSLIVNKGSDDGLTEGQVVIDAGGALIGRIEQVDPTNAKILLVNDSTAIVVGKEVKSGAIGTIQGSISGQLKMSSIDVTPDVAKTLKGLPVVTAGESLACTNDTSPYPPGLLIGTITTVSSDPNAVVQSATIAPAAHLTDATFLLVITGYQGGFGPSVPAGCLAATPSPSGSGGPKATASAGTSAVPGSSPTPGFTCPPKTSASPTVRPTPTPNTGY
jgi:rod shape-determining protein MreC